MKILLLGGCGFIATNIAIEAIKRGHTIVAFDNLSRKEVKNNLTYMEENYKDSYEFIWGDVRKYSDFDRLPFVDAVINLAANPSVVKSIEFPDYDFETNCMGTVNSLKFARKMRIPYIYASTNKVYTDITNELAMREEETRFEIIKSPLNKSKYKDFITPGVSDGTINEFFPVCGLNKFGHSLYGVSKLAGELYCQEYHLQFNIPMVIFRMSCIFGIFQKGVQEQAWVDHFIRQILNGEPITLFGSGKQVRDVLDGRDTARAYLNALENIHTCNGEIFTLGGGELNTYSLLEAIQAIKKIAKKKANIKFADKRPADQDVYVSNISKVCEFLNWKPEISFHDSIVDMIKQYEK